MQYYYHVTYIVHKVYLIDTSRIVLLNVIWWFHRFFLKVDFIFYLYCILWSRLHAGLFATREGASAKLIAMKLVVNKK